MATIPVETLSGNSESVAQHLDWLNDIRERTKLEREEIPLKEVQGWELEAGVVRPTNGNYFQVAGVHTKAKEREVSSWSQPLLKHEGMGLTAFLSMQKDGVNHYLVNAKVQAGNAHKVELSPTVAIFDYLGRKDRYDSYPFIDQVLDSSATIRFSTIQSEEGGRFWNLRARHMVVDTTEEKLGRLPENYRWMSLWEMKELMKTPAVVSSEIRSLVSMLYE